MQSDAKRWMTLLKLAEESTLNWAVEYKTVKTEAKICNTAAES